MAFVKLDCGILDSTLWLDREAREIFLTALLMSEPFELKEPTPQIEVATLDLTGWVVPPGWYGFARAAGNGLVHRAGIDQTTGREALQRLCSPETVSRTPDFDGRRLARVPGGFIVLNFMRYRERDYTSADRSKRYRERLQESRRSVTASRRDITQAEVEVQEEASTKVPTVDRSTYRTSDRNLMSSVLSENTAQPTTTSIVPQKVQGAGALPAGSLPRDHIKHAVCGKQYRICIPTSVYAKFSRRYGPDDAAARPAIEGFVNNLEVQIGDGSVGDYLWLEKHFDAWLIHTGRVIEPLKGPQKKTKEEIVAEMKVLSAKNAERVAKNKAANRATR